MPSCELSPVEQAICVWTDGPHKFAIHMAPEVIGGLGTESRIAFKRVPRRGLEIGGILLGRTCSDGDLTTFWIDGFQPIESEHRTGPSYIMSDADRVVLQTALSSNEGACVGLYRSHTRSERPNLQDTDNELFEKYLSAGDALFLILGPAAGMAALFLRTMGNLTCVHEFALASTLESIMALGQTVQTSPKVAPDSASPGAVESRLRPRRRALPIPELVFSDSSHEIRLDTQQRATPPRALAAGLLSLLKQPKWGFYVLLACLTLAATVSALSYSRRPPIPTDQHRPEYIHLTVAPAGRSLRVIWDRDSPAIRRATRAVLHIDDGAYHSDLGLVPSQLREGNLIYEPKSPEETFRLDVYSVEPTATGVVQVINVAPAAAPGPSPPVTTNNFRPAPILTPVTPPASHPAPKLDPIESPAARPPTPGLERPTNHAPGTQGNPPPVALEKPRPSSIPEKYTDSTNDREPLARVSTKQPTGSRLGHLVGKIPLLRRLAKPAKTDGDAVSGAASR
jgi:hypothetical protein